MTRLDKFLLWVVIIGAMPELLVLFFPSRSEFESLNLLELPPLFAGICLAVFVRHDASNAKAIRATAWIAAGLTGAAILGLVFALRRNLPMQIYMLTLASLFGVLMVRIALTYVAPEQILSTREKH